MDLPSHWEIDWPVPAPEAPTTFPAALATPTDWLAAVAPDLTRVPLAPHHARLWDHVWGYQRGVRSRGYVLILARGGAKSTTAELAVIAAFARDTRRYCWYVSRTQDQADDHVAAIGERLESAALAAVHPRLSNRLVNKYGYSESWRVNRLRTASGHTVDAIGIDKAVRGRRVNTQRPDLIVFDDIDDVADTPEMVEELLSRIKLKILPAGAPELTVIAVQNLITARGVFARLVDGTAGMLQDAVIDGPHPALLPHPGQTSVVQDDGTVDGIPTWAGQDVAICNQYVIDQGLPAFLSEAQHAVAQAGRYYQHWSDDRHLADPPRVTPAWPLWAALDYGYDHPLAFGVFGIDPASGDLWQLCEYTDRQQTVDAYAAGMTQACQDAGIDPAWLRRAVAGTDLFAQRTDRKRTFTLAELFAAAGWWFQAAQNDRVTGWRLIGDLLGTEHTTPRFRLARRCVVTARQLAGLVRDPKRPEDAAKTNARNGIGGDDAADMCRYGVMEHERMRRPPPQAPTSQSARTY